MNEAACGDIGVDNVRIAVKKRSTSPAMKITDHLGDLIKSHERDSMIIGIVGFADGSGIDGNEVSFMFKGDLSNIPPEERRKDSVLCYFPARSSGYTASNLLAVLNSSKETGPTIHLKGYLKSLEAPDAGPLFIVHSLQYISQDYALYIFKSKQGI